MSKKVLAKAGPDLRATLDAVSAKLTTRSMQEMNAAVQLRKQTPAAVARAFLEEQGLN